jgi:hypothetical protein
MTGNVVRTDTKARVIVQDGLPPHRMECWSCGKAFTPTPAKSGPNKGTHTDSSLDRAANEHWSTCRA